MSMPVHVAQPRSPLLAVLVVGLLVAVLAVVRAGGSDAVPVVRTGPPALTADVRARSFTWDGVAPGDRAAIQAAIARARPDAQRLIAATDGLVTLRVGGAGANAAGVTQTTASGYDVTLDLASVSRTLGQRGIERLVLHELGHVVDFQLVPPATDAVLDAGIPRGYGCEDGVGGSCAAPEERFAESFAKWALDDIGVNLSIGYKVPPPSAPLSTWGAPLSALAIAV